MRGSVDRTQGLLNPNIKESTLRTGLKVAAAVTLIVAGGLLGAFVQPEVGGTMIAAGLHLAIDTAIAGHDRRRHPKADLQSPAPALAFS